MSDRIVPRLMLAAVATGALASLVLAGGAHVAALMCAGRLGAGYGICMIAGLVEVQDLMRPAFPGSLSGIYYSLCYLGFALPAALAALADHVTYPVMLAGVAAVAAASLAVVTRAANPATPAT